MRTIDYPGGTIKIVHVSGVTKPNDVKKGSVYYEMDTDAHYRWDGAAWVYVGNGTAADHLEARGIAVAPAVASCADLVERFYGGFHHMEPDQLHRIKWDNPSMVEFTYYGGLDSYDFDRLTRLVFLAHDLCVRVEVLPCNMQRLKIRLCPRRRCENIMLNHPTLEEAVGKWHGQRPKLSSGHPTTGVSAEAPVEESSLTCRPVEAQAVTVGRRVVNIGRIAGRDGEIARVLEANHYPDIGAANFWYTIESGGHGNGSASCSANTLLSVVIEDGDVVTGDVPEYAFRQKEVRYLVRGCKFLLHHADPTRDTPHVVQFLQRGNAGKEGSVLRLVEDGKYFDWYVSHQEFLVDVIFDPSCETSDQAEEGT